RPIWVSPSRVVALGGNITIRCESQYPGMDFFLRKRISAQGPLDLPVAGIGRGVQGWVGARVWLSACLLCADPNLPRPSISLSPTGVTTPGADVTIRCQGQRRYVRFFLHKAGDPNPQQHMDAAGDGAEYRIPTVGRQHGGSYSCSYRPRSERGAVSLLFNSSLLLKAGREYPKPPIWVSPSTVVAIGGSVTIRCKGRYGSMKFFLHKAGHLNPQVQSEPNGTVAEFPIPSVSREDGGNYTCDYRPITAQNRSSYPSDPIEIIVGGEGEGRLSVPAPSPTPISLGGAVTVRCRGQRRGVRFMLNKERRHFPPADSDGFDAVFSFSKVHSEHGGSYSCSYHSRSEPFAVSYPSDPVELVVRGEGPGSASPFPAPPPARPSRRLGANETLRCQGQRRYVRFFLHKAGDLNPQRHMDPPGNRAEFRIPTVGRQHGGNYSCSYRNRSEPFLSSEPSDPLWLVVAARPESVWPGLTGAMAP
uniref:Ig-like domain-containing protein n=1 Tax=Chrysemys picta bellii TaxID=8478 RepID=A0A8C3HVB8_CHRPI